MAEYLQEYSLPVLLKIRDSYMGLVKYGALTMQGNSDLVDIVEEIEERRFERIVI